MTKESAELLTDAAIEMQRRINKLEAQIDALLAACEAAGKLAVEIHGWCASGEAVQAHVRDLIQANAVMIASDTSAAIARVRGQEG